MIEVAARATPGEFDAAFDRWLLREHPGGPTASVRWKLSPEHATAEVREAVGVQRDQLTAALDALHTSIDAIRAWQAMHEGALAHRGASRRRVTLFGVACLAFVLGVGIILTHPG